LFAKQQQLNGNSNGQRQMHAGGGIPHSHNGFLGTTVDYQDTVPERFDKYRMGTNTPVGQNTPVNTLYNPDTQYKGPVPTGGIYNPGIAPPMFQDPSWWNNMQQNNNSLITPPPGGVYQNVPEAGAPTTGGGKVDYMAKLLAGDQNRGYTAPSAPTYGSNFFNQMQQPVRPTGAPINKVTTSNITPTTKLAPAPDVNTTPTSQGTNWGKVGTMAG
jgi:hypothetical protein